MQENGEAGTPEQIGILALAVHVPATYVSTQLSLLLQLNTCVRTADVGQSSRHTTSAATALALPCGPAALPARRDSMATSVQVSQQELEEHDGVPAGKYTAGLGQVRRRQAPSGRDASICAARSCMCCRQQSHMLIRTA